MTPRVRGGMTLMELVVGLAITGAMAAAGAAAFGSIIDHRRVIRDSTVEMERASALRDMLRTWIMSGTVLLQTGGVPRVGTTSSAMAQSGTAITAAVSTGDELTFTTTAANPAMAPNARMRLFVDADNATPEQGLTLEYQATAQAPLQRRQLEGSIGGMRVEFLDQRTNRWRPYSDAAAIQPIAVRVSLLPFDGATLPGILQLPMIFKMGQQ